MDTLCAGIHPGTVQRKEVAMTPEEIWDKYHKDADWERVDFVDPPYCWECNITLEVDGYKFSGYGTECCGNREIESLECITPEGKTVKIY